MRSRTESILVVVAALVWGAAAAHSPIDIQPVPGSIHEIGYVCLEEVNPTSYPCGGVDLISSTTSDEEERVQSQEQTPVPNWMKRSDGQALTWKEVKQLKSAMPLKVSPKHCKHGVQKPEKGDFSVYIFCDDALGTTIGVILSKPGVGPVATKGVWATHKRFWQDRKWALDVNSILWGESGNFLYVDTGEVYNDGFVYELDLRNRKAKKIGKALEGGLVFSKKKRGSIELKSGPFKIAE